MCGWLDRTLSSIRSDEAFRLFWQSSMIRLKEVDIDEPQLPRGRNVPARLEIGTSEGSHPSTPEDLYRQQYFDCLDRIVKCIKDRFLTSLVLQCWESLRVHCWKLQKANSVAMMIYNPFPVMPGMTSMKLAWQSSWSYSLRLWQPTATQPCSTFVTTFDRFHWLNGETYQRSVHSWNSF